MVSFAHLSKINEDLRRGFPFGISITIALNTSIVVKIPTGLHLDYYYEMEAVSKKLKDLSNYIEYFIKAKGFNAFSQASIKQDSQYRTPIPYKTVATRAGLGWIGKLATLVTEEFGNAIRINSVLTDMPLLTGEPINKSKCESCTLCVKKCTGKAVQGDNWRVGIDRDALLDAFACKAEVIRRGKPFGLDVGTCGVCIAVCKYTQQYILGNFIKTSNGE